MPRFLHTLPLFSISLIPIFYFVWLERITLYKVPIVDKDGFWGSGNPTKDDDQIKLFTIDINDHKISQLKSILNSSRLTEPLENDVNLQERSSFMRNLLDVMLSFDWKQHQYFLNTFKQYKTEVEGLDVHFVRSSPLSVQDKEVVPILLIHGFLGSYWDFFKVIPVLSNPTRYGFAFGVKKGISFDVVVPSLPGYVFSSKPMKNGLTITEISRILSKMMARLNIHRYFIHGSEYFGSDVASTMAALFPDQVYGIHVSNPFVHPWFSPQVATKYIFESHIGYDREDHSKATSLYDYYINPVHRVEEYPDVLDKPVFTCFITSGDSFLSSPLGLASYLMHRWSLFSTRGSPVPLNKLFTLDELATFVYLYWLTDTAPHALRILKNCHDEEVWKRMQVSVPSAIVQSTQAPWYSSYSILKHKFTNITSYTQLPKGGLFHHLQDPHSVSADIFGFVERLLM